MESRRERKGSSWERRENRTNLKGSRRGWRASKRGWKRDCWRVNTRAMWANSLEKYDCSWERKGSWMAKWGYSWGRRGYRTEGLAGE